MQIPPKRGISAHRSGSGNAFATGPPAPLRRKAPIRRRSSSTNGHNHRHLGSAGHPQQLFRKSRPTFWIGVSMFCLVIIYVIAIVSVTRVSWTTTQTTPQQEQQQQQPLPLQVDAQRKKTLSDQIKAAREEQEEKKKHKSPYRQHHLENQFGHDVQPDILIPPNVSLEDGQISSNGDASLMEEQDDIVYKQEYKDKPHPQPDAVLTAYIEQIDFNEWKTQPLPQRKLAKAEKLTKITYPQLRSCQRLIQQWPVDEDNEYSQPPPTLVDSFLPWIHDVFPTHDGKYIQFVAQNRRRCHTGKKDKAIISHMAPQASLFQHVPVKRVTDPQQDAQTETRYQLVPHDQADPDGITTRFICRFKPSMEETLSVFNFDYDWTAYRKHYKQTFKEDDGGIKSIHTTQLIFRCPVPESLQETIRTGGSVDEETDWAKLFVDLIPIRTPPRYGDPTQFLAPWYKSFETPGIFDPVAAWGDSHVLPKIEDSGRWENIPICKPSLMTFEGQTANDLAESDSKSVSVTTTDSAGATNKVPPVKKHRLVSCIWASAGYTTRGNRFAINDGQRRLLEWISHNKEIGFDHFYVYDNTHAFMNETSLKGIAKLFPGEVTYIPWPSKICNNNPNNVDSPGERSSQYAAEASCRLRFGPHVDWIGQFDIDEYLIPMGEHNTALSLLDKLDKEDIRIISFQSWRAWPRWAFIDEPEPITDPHECWSKEPCFQLQIPLKHTMLQAYNCDRQKPGEKKQAMPAEKQIYRADYVTQHFIHYSAATVLSELNRTEYEKQGFIWYRRGFPDKRQRFADEVTEGLMIHTKAVARQDTAGWQRVCHIDNLKKPKGQQGLCRLGVPWPTEKEEYEDPAMNGVNATKEGWAYNCYVNEKVEKFYIPKLEASLQEKLKVFDKK